MWTHTLSRIKDDSKRSEGREATPAFGSMPPSLPSMLLVVPEGPSPPSTLAVLPVVPVFGVKVVGVVELGVVVLVLVLVGVLDVPVALTQRKKEWKRNNVWIKRTTSTINIAHKDMLNQ